MDETKIVLLLDRILQTLMITKVNVNRSNKPSQDDKFGGYLFSIHFSDSLYLKTEMWVGSKTSVSEIAIAVIIKT